MSDHTTQTETSVKPRPTLIRRILTIIKKTLLISLTVYAVILSFVYLSARENPGDQFLLSLISPIGLGDVNYYKFDLLENHHIVIRRHVPLGLYYNFRLKFNFIDGNHYALGEKGQKELARKMESEQHDFMHSKDRSARQDTKTISEDPSAYRFQVKGYKIHGEERELFFDQIYDKHSPHRSYSAWSDGENDQAYTLYFAPIFFLERGDYEFEVIGLSPYHPMFAKLTTYIGFGPYGEK